MIAPSNLLSYLPEHPVIVEAGAHHGEDTVALATQAEHVYAFEPIPAVYTKLKEATSELTNVTAIPLALSISDGPSSMWVASGEHDASSSLLPPKDHKEVFPGIEFKRMIGVQTTTLLTWAKRWNVERIDGMWLDAQGAELQILKSAGHLLDSTQAIMLEISLTELYAGCALWPDVRKWLVSRGFEVVVQDIYHDHFGEALVVRR